MRSRPDTHRLSVLAAITMHLPQLLPARSRSWRLWMTLILCVLGGAFAAGATAPPALAAVGTCPASESALKTAITNAGADGTVLLSCTTNTTISFSPNGTGSTGIAGTEPMTISQSVTLNASGSPAPITFDGHSDTQLFVVNGGVTFGLSVVTLANGLTTTGNGGAINNAGTVTVTGTTFSGNSAPGGAIFSSGSLTVTNSTFSGNSGGEAGGGGAIFNSSGSLRVTNSTFSGNSALDGEGGAILNGGTGTVTNSTFSGNSAPGKFTDGGAISNSATLTVTNSTFSGNLASNPSNAFDGTDQGGAISNSAGLSVTNTTFSGNSAGFGSGGAISNSGSLTVTSSTFSGNSAGDGGGGAIFNDGAALLGAVGGSIIANSTSGGNCGGAAAITDNGHNLTDDGTCGFTGTGDLQNTNPRLGALANNGGPTQTMALLPGSPAIDLVPATGAGCPATDERGVKRPQGSACDAGAVEDAANPPANTTAPTNTNTPTTPANPTTGPNALAQPPATTGWAGTWNTDFGLLTLTQNGNQVTGTFQDQNGNPGAVTGTANGNVLNAAWDLVPSTPGISTITLVLTESADGTSFTGTFHRGGGATEPWNGTRAGP